MRDLKFSDVIVVGLFILGCLAVFTQSIYTKTNPENNIVEANTTAQPELTKPSI